MSGQQRSRTARHGGWASLTPRELEVLQALAGGATAAAIGHTLGISERTVHRHLSAVYDKTGTHDRLAAVVRAMQDGVLPFPRQEQPTDGARAGIQAPNASS